MSASELLEEPQVAAEEVSDVVEVVTHHHESIQAEAESETLPALGVDVPRPQDVRMHHAAAAELDPSRLLAHAAAVRAERAADVELEARLDEGEVAGPQPHLEVALEELAQEALQRPDEMSDCDA